MPTLTVPLTFMPKGSLLFPAFVEYEAGLTQAAYSTIEGQTDSEVAFAIFLDHIG